MPILVVRHSTYQLPMCPTRRLKEKQRMSILEVQQIVLWINTPRIVLCFNNRSLTGEYNLTYLENVPTGYFRLFYIMSELNS